MIQIVYDDIPPSINRSYGTRAVKSKPQFGKKQKYFAMMYAKAPLKDFKENFQSLAKVYNIENEVFKKNEKLCIIIEFFCKHERLYCKNGDVKTFDSSNLVKSVEDAAAKKIGLNDKQFFWHVIRKRETSENEQTHISIMRHP